MQRSVWIVAAAGLLLLLAVRLGATPPPAAAHPPGGGGSGPPATTVSGPALIDTPTLTPCAGGATFLNRSITASDTPFPNRLSQNGVASVCGTNKGFTGSIPTSGHHYDQYTLTNNTTQSQ